MMNLVAIMMEGEIRVNLYETRIYCGHNECFLEALHRLFHFFEDVFFEESLAGFVSDTYPASRFVPRPAA